MYNPASGNTIGLHVTFILFALSLPINAQTLLEEITVTAQKREQNIQDVGISITAFTGDQIRELGYTNSIDIAQQTPGLNIIQFHPSVTTLNIRGVSQNSFGDHLEAPIAVYVDGAYVSAMGAAHVQIFDLERAEVLKGPQGTLFGRNATGGLLHYISAKPTEEFTGYGEFTYAEYDQIKFEGALSGALSDNLQGRLSVAVNNHDGIIENRIGDDLRDTDSYSIRGQLQYQASEDLDIHLKVHYSEDDSNGNGYTHGVTVADADGLDVSVPSNQTATFFDFFNFVTFPAPCVGCDAYGYTEPDDDVFTGSYDEVGYFRRDIFGVTGTLNWELGNGMTVTSITDYLDMDKSYLEDTDASPNPVAIFPADQQFDQISQEFRISQVAEDYRWMAGAYYLHIDSNQLRSNFNVDFSPFISTGFVPLGLAALNVVGSYRLKTDSWAVFGNVEYDLNDDWSVIAGLRYTEDERNMSSFYTTNFFVFPPDVFDSSNFPGLSESKYDNVSAKLEVDWRPYDDLLLYASYTRGHKAGNYQSQPGDSTNPAADWEHGEEVLTSYEIGFKSDFWDNKARLNASGFYYDYDDYQAFFVDNVTITTALFNADAEVLGAEAQLTLQPNERLELMFGVSLLDTKVKDVVLPSARVTDRDLPYSPEFGINGLARYTWPAFNGTLAVQGDFNYSDAFCFTVLCAPIDEEGSYVIANARVSYTTADEHWRLSAFVNNLTDTEYRVYTLGVAISGQQNDVYGSPRWFGGSISYNF